MANILRDGVSVTDQGEINVLALGSTTPTTAHPDVKGVNVPFGKKVTLAGVVYVRFQ